jgi:5'(3')-deoxyribonucleotidase
LKHNIILDIDGVVADSNKAIVEAYKDRGKEWDYGSTWEVDFIKNQGLFQEPEWFMDFDPIPSSVEFIKKWFDKFNIVYATARDIPLEDTMHWLDVWEIPYREVMTAKIKDKYRLSENKKALCYVDDSPEHYGGFMVNRIVYDYKYNRELNVPRVTSLFDLESLVKELKC